MAEAKVRRIFVGGLNADVKEEQVKDRFRSFGDVVSVNVVRTPDGTACKGFGYVDMMISDANLKRCQSLYTNTKWMGNTLKVAEAKPSFTARLQQEWVKDEALEKKRLKRQRQHAKKNAARIHQIDFKRMDDEEYCKKVNWAKARYNRALPIMEIKVPGKRNTMKLDPKKVIIGVKRFKGDEDASEPEPSAASLTWYIPEEGEAMPEEWTRPIHRPAPAALKRKAPEDTPDEPKAKDAKEPQQKKDKQEADKLQQQQQQQQQQQKGDKAAEKKATKADTQPPAAGKEKKATTAKDSRKALEEALKANFDSYSSDDSADGPYTGSGKPKRRAQDSEVKEAEGATSKEASADTSAAMLETDKERASQLALLARLGLLSKKSEPTQTAAAAASMDDGSEGENSGAEEESEGEGEDAADSTAAAAAAAAGTSEGSAKKKAEEEKATPLVKRAVNLSLAQRYDPLLDDAYNDDAAAKSGSAEEEESDEGEQDQTEDGEEKEAEEGAAAASENKENVSGDAKIVPVKPLATIKGSLFESIKPASGDWKKTDKVSTFSFFGGGTSSTNDSSIKDNDTDGSAASTAQVKPYAFSFGSSDKPTFAVTPLVLTAAAASATPSRQRSQLPGRFFFFHQKDLLPDPPVTLAEEEERKRKEREEKEQREKDAAAATTNRRGGREKEGDKEPKIVQLPAPRTKFFMREGTVEDMTQRWEERRLELTRDFKSKHKAARKRAERLMSNKPLAR